MVRGLGFRMVLAGAALGALGLLALLAPRPVAACGGFFCNGGGPGPTPVVQAAERVIFEQRPDGSVRAYIQIRYDQQATVGFSWIIPVLAIPEVGIAESATFDQLDNATNPQFRFINNSVPTRGGGGGGGGGCGVGGAADRAAFGAPEAGVMDVNGVTVWETSRVGDYETAILEGDTAADILRWLESNEFDIPAEATDLLDTYVEEGHLFVAFRYDPIGPGRGTLDPVVLTYRGVQPCVPIRITAIASTPILDVMVLAFGPARAAPMGVYVQTEPDYAAVRPDFSAGSQTTYEQEVLAAISDAGGLAFVTEYAQSTEDGLLDQTRDDAVAGIPATITDREAVALIERNPYVTRLYTRMTPEAMIADPEFHFPGGPDLARLHVVDITPRSARVGAATGTLRFAAMPLVPLVLLGAGLALAWRRRRTRH